VLAVVSRGGRPDLANAALRRVHAPTLLIVGGHDQHVLTLNENAAEKFVAPHRIEVVPGATHLFEEPGALDRVSELAGGWFDRHLRAPAGQGRQE
jgi:pimeloyl-ACP methyl ester carboxylesterase